MASTPSAERRTNPDSRHAPFSDGGSMDRDQMADPGKSIHPRHHSTAGLVFGPSGRKKHHTDSDIASVLSGENPSPLALGPRERANSETPFISAVSLWSPRNLFGSASSVKRRATVHHDRRPHPVRRNGENKSPEVRDAAWSLRKWDNPRLRERTVVPPGPDNAGIYEAMTGSTLVRRSTLPCDEDHRPHVCLHELSDDSD